MHTNTLHTEEAKNKAWAVMDRRQRNLANSTHYTEQQRVRAERMRMALTLCYAGTVYEPSYGTTGVSVKVTGHIMDPQVLEQLESVWSSSGVIKRQTAQGTLYRFKK